MAACLLAALFVLLKHVKKENRPLKKDWIGI